MGYYASGSGVLKLKSEVPEDVLALLSWENAGFSEVADSPDGGLWLTFEYSRFHDDDMVHAMNKIAQYVESGDVEFCGEDDSHWRYHFRNGKMEEQSGEVVYKSSKNARSFRIEFTRKYENGDGDLHWYDEDSGIVFDETEFDTSYHNNEVAWVDLINLFNDFVAENHFKDTRVTAIEEVPYDGEEE